MMGDAANPSDKSETKPTTGQDVPPAPQRFAFLSYVHEDSHRIDRLQQRLEAAGIQVWRDTGSLWPGEDWRIKIRQAITADALVVFIACFSHVSTGRARSYQNEEFLLAIDQYRQLRPGTQWLIPVRLDDCKIPDLDIGGGRTLPSLQSADLFGDRAEDNLARLIGTVVRADGPPGLKSGQRRGLVSGRRGPVIMSAIVAALLSAVAYAVFQLVPDPPVTVTGSVVCESGQPLVGVWIAASTGQDDSGFAHLGPPNTNGPSFPDSAEGTYSYRLPHGGSYAVHVGCGQNKHGWLSSDYSPLLSTRTANLRCGQSTSANSKPMAKGRCVLAAAP